MPDEDRKITNCSGLENEQKSAFAVVYFHELACMLLPGEFRDRMALRLGEEASSFFKALAEEPPVSIRLNPFKPVPLFTAEATVPWCRDGRYLPKRPSFTRDPYFHAGCYYVQEASSMYIGWVVEEFLSGRSVRTALDLCAAPGGKSTHLRSLLPEETLLVCNEVVPSRNHILCQSLAKWGHPGVVVTRNEAEDFVAAGLQFDLLLVDAPCSGEGMFRKDPGAVSEWSPQNVGSCAIRQKQILDQAVQLLAPGGMLVYSTCTWSEEEDQQIAKVLRDLHGLVPRPLPSFPGIMISDDGAVFYPHLVKGEGFFVTAFTKPLTAVASSAELRARRKLKPLKEDQQLKDFVRNQFSDDSLQCFRIGDSGWAVPVAYVPQWESLCASLRVVSSGIKAAEWKGNGWIPTPESALSIRLSEDVSRLEVDDEQALRYLRGETLSLERSVSGWQLVSFAGFGLGWGKGVQGRLNNAFPKEWRIRMDIDKK